MMNEFTKEELKELMYGLWCRAKIDGMIVNKTLYDKIKFMIDNYNSDKIECFYYCKHCNETSVLDEFVCPQCDYQGVDER